MSAIFYQIILMIVGIIIPRIMLKYYGSEINGLVSSISQFVSYFYLVEAGLSAATVYALYKPLADKNENAINAVVSAARKFYIKTGYVFSLLVLVFAIFYSFYIKTPFLSPMNIGFLIMVLGANGLIDFFALSKYRVLLTADQKNYVISLSSVVYLLLNTFIIIILGTKQVNIVILKLVAILPIFLKAFMIMIYAKHNYKYLNHNEKPNTKALDKRWDALYLQILGLIQSGAPIIILTFITKDLKLISLYSIFNIVIAGVNGILSIFQSGLPASFGEIIAKGEKKTLQKSYNEFEFFYYSLITVIYSITFVTIMPFIKIYTSGITDFNYNMPIVGFLFVLNGLLFNLKTPQGMLVISAGMYKETRVQSTIQGVLIVLFGLILTPFIGIYGVLIAAIISNFYRDIDLLLFVPKKITGLPIIDTLKRLLRVLITSIIICLPFQYVNFVPSGYIEWILYATVIGVYSVIVVLIVNFLFDRKALIDIIRRILRMVKK